MQASNPESRFRSGPSDYPGMTVLMSAPRRPRFPDRLPNLLRRQRRVERLDAGFRIDLDFADMRAVWPARPIDFTFAVDAQARAILFLGNIEQADPFVGTDHREHAVVVFDVLDGSLQHVRGLLASLGNQILGGDRQRCAPDEQRARADAAEPGGEIRVAL